ncbi:MAG: S-adenosylmethionine:tRNA ribosyltransferase-isomerase, partial [Nitrospirae bacterium]|nr:S-adenosylmethionine:tRNA ribosyltransferase-isomerase [Nitrospirota bacterium]
MKIDDFDYPFDPSLIALYPLPKRDQSRLLVLERGGGRIEHRRFFETTDYLDRGDVLVLNNTKVTPCRIAGKKEGTGGHVELLLIRRHEGDIWEAMAGGRLRTGTKIIFSSSCCGEVMGHQDGHVVVKFSYEGEWERVLSKIGQMPIPPYIKRDPVEEDREWYQTVYAAKEGAIAAPTAGLHFTEEMFDALRAKGVSVVCITLHVGIGTFKPVKVEWIEGHRMGSEWFEVGGEA